MTNKLDFAGLAASASRNAGDAPCILVWQFRSAPKAYQDLSGHRGDEDWIAYVPASLAEEYIGWMQDGGPFGCCSVSEHKLANGAVVRIGAHA